jgi:hypothetical protein
LKIVSLRNLLLLLTLCFLVSVPSFASAVTQTDAMYAITSAQNRIIYCYNAAKIAEASGANITLLQISLNDAGKSLSSAELAYSNGDYNSTINFANQCQNALLNLVSNANALTTKGEQQQNENLAIFVGSIVGSFAVMGAGYVVWLRIKKKYTN